MIRRFAARLALACYGVTALGGQGMHAWIEPADWHAQHAEHGGHAEHRAGAPCGSDHNHGPSEPESRHEEHEHDCDHCVVCQFHALGQLFAVAAPVVTGPVECGSLKPTATESVDCVALYSPVLPRAPPAI